MNVKKCNSGSEKLLLDRSWQEIQRGIIFSCMKRLRWLTTDNNSEWLLFITIDRLLKRFEDLLVEKNNIK